MCFSHNRREGNNFVYTINMFIGYQSTVQNPHRKISLYIIGLLIVMFLSTEIFSKRRKMYLIYEL